MASTVDMPRRQRWTLVFLACVGTAACVAGIAAFVLGIVQNSLPWHPNSIREHYLAVGDSYSQGFLAGFFLCFFLSLMAVAIGSWVEQRRSRDVFRSSPCPAEARSGRASSRPVAARPRA